MTRLRLKHVDRFTGRHGEARHYFRRGKGPRIALPGLPGSDEFMQAYRDALAGNGGPAAATKRVTGEPGSFRRLACEYFASGEFITGAKPNTRIVFRRIIEAFVVEHGHRQVTQMRREDVRKVIALKADTPAAANNLLKRLRRLMDFAVEQRWRIDNPTVGVKPLKLSKHGFKTWPEELIEQFRAHHPLGSKPRLALELFSNTGQRLGDVIRMGPQHIREGVFSFRQQKTGAQVDIPVLPDLRAALDASPVGHLTFIVTDYGRPFTSAGFGNWFRDQCRAAGLPPGYSAHGLRKAAATRHAHNGATASMLMAWFGWSSIKEAELYTRTADRARLAVDAAALIAAARERNADKNSQPRADGLGNRGKKRVKS